jgi:hypothetical protein
MDALEVTDDDTPQLTLTFAATEISEGAGAAATLGTVARNTDTTAELTVMLSSNNAGEASVPMSGGAPGTGSPRAGAAARPDLRRAD